MEVFVEHLVLITGIKKINNQRFCIQIMHWVHHANRIQDDLRKSCVFIKKEHMLQLGSTYTIIYVYCGGCVLFCPR